MSFPTEIWFMILSYLKIKQLIKIARVNILFNEYTLIRVKKKKSLDPQKHILYDMTNRQGYPIFFNFSQIITTKKKKYVEFNNIKTKTGKPSRRLLKYTSNLKPYCITPRKLDGLKYIFKGERKDLEHINKKKCDNCNELKYFKFIYIHFRCGIKNCKKKTYTITCKGISTNHHFEKHTHFLCDKCLYSNIVF
jgi:hypothetical protein